MSDTPTYVDAPVVSESIQRQIDEYAAGVERRLNLPPLAPGWKWNIRGEVTGRDNEHYVVRFSATPERIVYFSEDCTCRTL